MFSFHRRPAMAEAIGPAAVASWESEDKAQSD